MNPYQQLPEKAFWRLGVADKSMSDIVDLWDPEFDIKPHHKISTFGSCFAQHIGKALDSRGFRWHMGETPPLGCCPELAKKYGYGVFSARTGNIYTASLLNQWTRWANAEAAVPDEIWSKDGRFYDPFRPAIEPCGFESEAELQATRAHTIACFKNCITDSDFFVFTLGLTESWTHSTCGFEYPMCPGTVAGDYVANTHRFENQKFGRIRSDLTAAIQTMRSINPSLRFLLTVSPVPLVATMSGKHVAVATMASKSILRAVADELANEYAHVDYFPSYEIINSPVFKGSFFEANQRSVTSHGVQFVMNHFFSCLERKYGAPQPTAKIAAPAVRAYEDIGDVSCEEELLMAYSVHKS
jgi:hypothetical protein